MTGELVSFLEQEAQAERDKILQEADESVRQILEKAKTKSEKEKAEAEQKSVRLGRTELEKARNALRLETQTELLQEKSRWLDKVWQETSARLMAFRTDPQYPAALEQLLQETLVDRSSIHWRLNPADVSMAESWLKKNELQGEIIADPTIDAGVLALVEKGRVEIANTPQDRLHKAWLQLLVEIARRLWK
jgi:vacuolar-type H+-ATPase subunit E/Vma4